MSVIQRIRDKGAWFVSGIIALALIAFILQDKFMGKGNLFSNTTDIGVINGDKIARSDFEGQVQLYEQMNGQEAGNDQTVSNVWNRTVFITLLNQEEKKLGLALTAKELNDVLFGANPPQWMTQAFTDPSTGQYNADAAKQQFAQMKKNINDPKVKQIFAAYVQPTIEQTLSQKYQALVAGGIYVPHWMAQKNKSDDEAVAKIRFVNIPYTSITDTAIKISDDEINTYIGKHEKQYEQKEETRSISFVKFDASPGKTDSDAVRSKLEELKPQLQTATDISSFISTKGSATPYDSAYSVKSTFKGKYSDTLMKLSAGEIFGPYIDGQNYVMAKMISERSMPDSAKCRHILIKTEDKGQPVLADSIAKKRIDSIAEAIAHGADFNTMVQQYSDDPGSKSTKGEYTFAASQFSGISKEFAQTIFYGKTGDKKVVHVSNSQYAGYHYIEVLDQKNIQKAYNIAYLSKPIEASAETINAASNTAEQFAANARTPEQFKANAAKQNLPVLPVPELHLSDFSAGALGDNRQLIKWVYDGKVGDVSDAVSAQNNSAYAVVLITAIHKKGTPDATTARPMVETILMNEKKAKKIIEKVKGNTLEAIAQSTGVSVQNADSISFRQPFIPNIGNEPKIAGAAFNTNIQKKISSPIAGNSAVFVIEGNGISSNTVPGGTIDELRKNMETQMRSQMSYGIIGALKDAAKIDDNRSLFY